jgi:phosphoenolpyruvate carboxylase
MERSDLLQREMEACRRAVLADVTAFWHTDRTRTSLPKVADEVRTALYFVDGVFWEVLLALPASLTHTALGLLRSFGPRLPGQVGSVRPNVTHG